MRGLKVNGGTQSKHYELLNQYKVNFEDLIEVNSNRGINTNIDHTHF